MMWWSPFLASTFALKPKNIFRRPVTSGSNFNEMKFKMTISHYHCRRGTWKHCLWNAANWSRGRWVNTLRPRQNGRHFPDDIFKCISLDENVSISLSISLKFVSKVRINNIQPLVQIMAWRRSGDKPLSEPVMVSLLMHICVTRPLWVKHWKYSTQKKGDGSDGAKYKSLGTYFRWSCWQCRVTKDEYLHALSPVSAAFENIVHEIETILSRWRLVKYCQVGLIVLATAWPHLCHFIYYYHYLYGCMVIVIIIFIIITIIVFIIIVVIIDIFIITLSYCKI